MTNIRTWSLLACTAAVVALASMTGGAHHAISAKFDDKKPTTMSGVVTLVDWRNPHVHVFMNVKDAKGVMNWAVEIESPIDLEQSGWNSDTLQPGDSITVRGLLARNDSRQVWGNSITLAATGRQVLKFTPKMPDRAAREASDAALGRQAAAARTDAGRRAGLLGVSRHRPCSWKPASTSRWTSGACCANIADASKVAPMQPWALALYRNRQSRFLQDDPTYLNCKPPGGPRQFQLPYGVQFVEDRERQRIFVLIGGGNANFRIIYLDGRSHAGQVGGDDDNPLYYGRSVGKWEGDVLEVDTRGFNEDFWFTNGGLPHTDQLRLIEKFSRPDFDTLKYEVTVEDTGAYTRPWSSGWTLRWVAGEELPRHLCQENRP